MIPTRAQLNAEQQMWMHYSREAGSVPVQGSGENRDLTPQDASQWGEQVLSTYSRDQRQNVTANQIREVASGFQAQNGGDWARLDPDQKRLSAVLTNSAAASLSESEFETEYALAEVAIETLRSGEITEQEVESMCSTAGSISGAVVGQAFGIPAPIGAFVGGLVGGVVGGVVASIAGLESGPTLADIALAQARRQAEQWNDWQRGVRRGCSENAQAYANRVDLVVRDLSEQLRDIERSDEVGLGGTQLRLVWSGEISPEDTPFYGSLLNVPGATRETWSTQICSDVSGARRCSSHPHEKYVCSTPGGCLIPSVGGQSLTERSEREVVNALMFYGAKWKAENDRYRWFCSDWPELDVNALALQNQTAGGQQMCNVYGTNFPPIGVVAPVLCDFYKATMREAADPHEAMRLLVPARLLTIQAIVKTAAVERARMDIAARRYELASTGARMRRSAWQIGQRRTWWANNGMLALGVGVLGYALWRARKEGRL